jgi:FKBP-type peptidyl-prolyl cis-trans isomerase FkpA
MYGDLKNESNPMVKRFILFILCLCPIASCKENPDKGSKVFRPGRNEMADLNRYFVQKDRERIQNYIERKNLKMTETSTGLWYQILNDVPGATFSGGSKIFMDYDCSLLDGTDCYSSEKLGPKEIILGESEIESGLNEGLHLLKPGSEAIFILPPYLAHGLIGDRKMIPPRAIIVYKVKILHTR